MIRKFAALAAIAFVIYFNPPIPEALSFTQVTNKHAR